MERISAQRHRSGGRELLLCNFLLVVTPGTSYCVELDASVIVRSSLGADAAEAL